MISYSDSDSDYGSDGKIGKPYYSTTTTVMDELTHHNPFIGKNSDSDTEFDQVDTVKSEIAGTNKKKADSDASSSDEDVVADQSSVPNKGSVTPNAKKESAQSSTDSKKHTGSAFSDSDPNQSNENVGSATQSGKSQFF